MGLRGPGARRLLNAREGVEVKPKRPAWERKGLCRSGRNVAFVQSLPITKGKLQGKRFRLLPGQRRFIEEIYGSRRVSIAVKSEPRGNGKTGLLAPLALCHLLGPEAEPRGEVYSAAIDRQQAGIMFNEMEAIILAVPEFAARVNIQRFHKRIEVLSGQGAGSTYEALSADARRAHGLAPSLWVYDELAQAKDRVLLDNLITAMGKRKQTLGVIISTQAPNDDHPLSQLIDDGLSGVDESILVHLSSAPEDADPFEVETLRACNPALGIFLDEGDLLKEAQRARRLPAFEAAYRNLRLNQRVDASTENRLATAAVWRLGATPVDLERLRGRRCFGGLDLSGKSDLTALVLVFPDEEPEPSYDIVPFFWTPEGPASTSTPTPR
jgi:phage terminase large subunit-like protein